MLIKKTFHLLCMCTMLFSCLRGSFITYQLSGGRLGDNLLAYLHAKWFSYKYKIPFAYMPFEYSNQFMLDQYETNINNVSYHEKKILTKRYEQELNVNSDILYSVPYFSEDKTEFVTNPHWLQCKVNWDDEVFIQQIKKMIYPKNEKLLHVQLPVNMISVALHMRRGGGYDQPLSEENRKKIITQASYIDLLMPLKFPPFSYYVESIKKLSEKLGHTSLYIYLFTDDKNPTLLVERLQRELYAYKNLVFKWRESENSHDSNVVEDFFAMTRFDCIIRPQSNFSIVASKIANYIVEIFPTDYVVTDNKAHITKVEMRHKEGRRKKRTVFID